MIGDKSELIATMMVEHSVIMAKLNQLDAAIVGGGETDLSKLSKLAVEFTKALNAHIEREETQLFPPIRDMLRDHPEALGLIEDEHTAVAELKAEFLRLSQRLSEGDVSTSQHLERLSYLTRQILQVLPAHIFKEDHVLYPLADQLMAKKAAQRK